MTEPLVIALEHAEDVGQAGGKAVALERLDRAGVPVPRGLVVTTAAYHSFVAHRGLRERIALELIRRPLEQLRPEETWDVALRLRALFVSAPWPEDLRAALSSALEPLAATGSLVVRSSAPHEDAANASFAGLHESVVGVDGLDDALEAVRSVWASLFTDRALLYHAELGLDASVSAMAVLVQPLIDARRAGVAFTRSPHDVSLSAVEGVWGLGEGLVSGRVEPDTWELERDSGRVVAHRQPERLRTLLRGPHALVERELEPALRERPPISDAEVGDVWHRAMDVERLFGAPVDCEWAIATDDVVRFTQARPITTQPSDQRSEYLASQASAEQLELLRADIEERILPAMRDEARSLGAFDAPGATDAELAAEAHRRARSVLSWREVYRSALIPMAHGARLLGRLYTDTLRPADPFDYLTLLVRSPEEYETHRSLLAELGSTAQLPVPDDSQRADAEARFLAAFDSADELAHARALLQLARASWRLRDDDNLYLALIEREADRVADEVRLRLERGPNPLLEDALEALGTLSDDTVSSNRPQPAGDSGPVRARQLLGQPAGPGVGSGQARVIRSAEDLRLIGPGDVVVADALEPDTAAYAARAAGIVERRGGMLVHGAIVAREHKIPCVTGVDDATARIRDGERLTVDGYLGIVVLEEV